MKVKVIAGEVFGVKGPITARTPAYFIDFVIKKGTTYQHVIPAEWNSMILCHQGQVTVQGTKRLATGHCAVFNPSSSKDEALKFEVLEDDTRFIMLAGKPLNEPIAARGPFVLNTEKQLHEAFDDY